MMEHLPHPSDILFANLPRVPYLAAQYGFSYPSQPQGISFFESYPLERGFNQDQLVQTFTSDRRSSAFLQSWLFFGLLAETFARPNYRFNRSDFIASVPTGEVVSTEALPEYVLYWLAARTQDERESMVELETTIDKCLHVTDKFLRTLNEYMWQHCQFAGQNAPNQSSESAIALSISLLGDYLTVARKELRQYTTAPQINWQCVYLDNMMKDADWCPREISTLNETCGLSSRYYLSMLDRKTLHKNHSRCSTSTICQANQLDYNTYEPAHVSCIPAQRCSEMETPIAKIHKAILPENGRAVIVTRLPGEDLDVIPVGGPGGRTIPYVAISHVWSDGRGNPRKNALPLCQIHLIQKLVNALYDDSLQPVPFWMDTLSIPVDKSHAHLRKIAIGRIAETFKLADKVLVLDNSLMQCDFGSPIVERLMRIRHSPWMTRLWTFLEGRLARNLFFQFRGGTVSGEDFHNSLVSQKNLIDVSGRLRSLQEQELIKTPSAIQLIRALATATSAGIVQYAGLPYQPDPDDEQLRQDAISILQNYPDYFRLRETWEPLLNQLGCLYELDDDDEVVRADMEGLVFCPITLHAFKSVASIREAGMGEYTRGLPGLPTLPDVAIGIIAHGFAELCGGLRGRTTSRLDDETLCIGGLVGANLNEIQSVTPLWDNWHIRQFAERVESKTTAHPVAERLAELFGRLTTCHAKRMIILLRAIKWFPLSVIFWNAPRMTSKPSAGRHSQYCIRT